jgi:hypothetical protein
MKGVSAASAAPKNLPIYNLLLFIFEAIKLAKFTNNLSLPVVHSHNIRFRDARASVSHDLYFVYKNQVVRELIFILNSHNH